MGRKNPTESERKNENFSEKGFGRKNVHKKTARKSKKAGILYKKARESKKPARKNWFRVFTNGYVSEIFPRLTRYTNTPATVKRRK